MHYINSCSIVSGRFIHKWIFVQIFSILCWLNPWIRNLQIQRGDWTSMTVLHCSVNTSFQEIYTSLQVTNEFIWQAARVSHVLCLWATCGSPAASSLCRWTQGSTCVLFFSSLLPGEASSTDGGEKGQKLLCISAPSCRSSTALLTQGSQKGLSFLVTISPKFSGGTRNLYVPDGTEF